MREICKNVYCCNFDSEEPKNCVISCEFPSIKGCSCRVRFNEVLRYIENFKNIDFVEELKNNFLKGTSA